MNVLSLKPFIKPGITTFILMLISYLGIWMVNILLLPEFSYSGMDLRDNRWPVASHLLALLLLITINSILLRRFVLHFSIIRTKSFLPVFFFLTFSVVWPEMRTNLFPHFFLTIFLISIELFFGMYRNHRAVEPAFLGSLLISLTSLIHPFYLLIFPILWIGWIILKSISVKSLLASFTGIAVPWIFHNSWFWYHGMELGFSPVFQTLNFSTVATEPISKSLLIYISILLFTGIISIIGLLSKLLDDSIQTRKNIYILVLTMLFTIAFSLFNSSLSHLYLPLTAFLVSVLMAHPFTLRKSLLYPLLFIVFSVCNILYLVFQHLQPFQ